MYPGGRRWHAWALLLAAAVLWAFVAYSGQRTRSGPIGFDAARAAGLTGTSLLSISLWPVPCLLLPPFVVAAPAAGALLAWRRSVRSRRWTPHRPQAALVCRSCRYPATGPDAAVCPECGSTEFGPARERWWAAWERPALVVAIGWLLGCAAAEGVLSADEAMFKREAAASGRAQYIRERRWSPHYGQLIYDGTQFWCVDD